MKTFVKSLLLVGAFLLSIVSLSNHAVAQNVPNPEHAESYRVNKFLEWVKSHDLSKSRNTSVYDDQRKIIGRYYDVHTDYEDIRVILASTNDEKIPYIRINFKKINSKNEASMILDYYLDGKPEIGIPSLDLIGRRSMVIQPDNLDPTKSDDIFRSILIQATINSWQQEYDRLLDLAK